MTPSPDRCRPARAAHGARCRAIALAMLALAAPVLAVEPTAVDLLISNARVVDGTGRPPRPADVAVGGGRILFVGDASGAALTGGETIDAQGRVLAPGFIDPHSHGDPAATPAFESFLAMGVTTISLGQDGSSPPVDDLAGWLEEVAGRGIGTNLAMFVGHGTLRELAGIGRAAEPQPARLDAMLRRLDDALAVAFGLSTGLEYDPGLHARAAELRSLAQVVGRRDRLIMSHLRNEDDEALQGALDELLAQGDDARVHVAHLKSVYGKGADRAGEILGWLDAARARGVRVSADVYPYTASYTGISLLFPEWAKTDAQLAAVRDDRYRELAEHLRRRVLARNGPEATLLGTAPYTGRTLAELAGELGKPFEEVLIDDIGPEGSDAAYFVMDDALQSALLLDPHVAVCSDGSPTGYHPRGHGAFARVIEEYVVARQALTLAEAVRKMTSLPASILGIADRGRIEVGMAADLVLFDPARVHAAATYTDPLALASGFDLVVVNGRIARRDGRLASGLHGRVLRPPVAVGEPMD